MGRVAIPILGIFLLLSIGIVFPAMADSSALRTVDSDAPVGKIFVSVDFDNDGICDKQAVLISTSTVAKIGITQQCILISI